MLLLKGSLENFQHSLVDFLERKSQLIRRFPASSFLWGAKRVDQRVRPGAEVLLYVNRNQFNEGGVALYGELVEVGELKERYWPQGDWPLYLVLKVKAIAEGVRENPHEPSRWRLIDRHALAQLGVKILPGIQTIPEDKLRQILSNLVRI